MKMLKLHTSITPVAVCGFFINNNNIIINERLLRIQCALKSINGQYFIEVYTQSAIINQYVSIKFMRLEL